MAQHASAGDASRLQSGSQPVLTGVAVLETNGRILHWGADAQALLGHPRAEAVGRYAGRLLMAREQRLQVRALSEQLLAGEEWAGPMLLRHRDGHLVELGLRVGLIVRPDTPALVLATAFDVQGARRVEADLAVLHGLFTQSPIGLAVHDEDLRFVRVNPALAKESGHRPEDYVGLRVGQMVPGVDAEAVEAMLRHVMETGEPVRDLQSRGRLPGDPDLERVWSSSHSRLENPDGRVLGVSSSVIDLTKRYQAQREAAAAQERLALLNDASTRIGTTLDLRRTAEELVEVVLHEFADFASVDLLESVMRGQEMTGLVPEHSVLLHAVAVGESNGIGLASTADTVGQTSEFHSSRIYAQALRSGRPILIPQVSLETLRTIVASPERVEPAGKAGLHSYLIAPLVARGVVLGGAEFARTHNSEPFDEADLALAEELAARAAICIDNARLYRREREIALTLQHSLLPEHVRDLPGLEIAHRYQPGSVGSEVGGDWFDVIPLSGARVALVVGDVMGHGIQAAATMGQLRTVARTLATLELDPEQVLTRLNEATGALGDSQFATCVCAVYDPVDRKCVLARAGHPPPVVVAPDGSTRLVVSPAGVPLGVEGATFESEEFTLPHGAVLVLYTDGLVERRGRDIEEGIDLLRRTVSKPGRTLQESCDAVLAALETGQAEDDIAIIMARTVPLRQDRIATLPLAGDPSSAGQARRFTRTALAAWQLLSLSPHAELLVSELVTNALLHSGAPRELRLFLDRVLTVEVTDDERYAPTLQRTAGDDEHGRGMYLVNELAHRWGSRPTQQGKVVWFELKLPPGSGR
jgi:PAS domain S-box-containing protein